MNSKNIPNADQFNKLVAGLTELEPIALALSRDPVHSQSPNMGSVLGRIRGGIEALTWHTKFLAALPDPQPIKAPDAKAGAPNA